MRPLFGGESRNRGRTTLCAFPSSTTPQEKQELLKNLIACPNHEKEEVVYLCKDHDKTCCFKCAIADHRKCEEVKVICDILNYLQVKTVLIDFQQQGERL
ncbi:hypothetical protein DPMN_156481 [Dreissena polymorpha]|uniref:B box-type domain-containing protein n=1 Tax=Dreissena polymorpha TaxID=45954 RepID=A0A9D4FQU0_DREPO|nr:hypothetical protein DPMN_156481 [Dreissena polymorpha]